MPARLVEDSVLLVGDARGCHSGEYMVHVVCIPIIEAEYVSEEFNAERIVAAEDLRFATLY